MKLKRHRRFYIGIIAVIVLVYLILLLIMQQAEAGSDSSHIHSFWDAMWYSIVTLTTVGYGDITPVTTVGRIVGLIFLLLSTGILVTLVGTFLSFVTSEGFPLLILSFQKKKDWYFFADAGPEAETLARQIIQEEPQAVIIYGCSKSALEETPDYPCMFASVSPARIAKIKRSVGNPCKVFFMKENDIGVNPGAVDVAQLPVEVYAKTASGEDNLPGDIHFFHSYDCCAREYWRGRPLTLAEHTIILIGFGKYGQALLTRAILTNVISPEHHVTYHIFGDVGNFLNMHPGLSVTFSIQQIDKMKMDNIAQRPQTSVRAGNNASQGSQTYAKSGNSASRKLQTSVQANYMDIQRLQTSEQVDYTDRQANYTDPGAKGKDTLVFHEDSWTKEHELLAHSDRVIICTDDEQEGWDIFWNIRQYYQIGGQMHLRSNRRIPGVEHFGTNESIYTPENILHTRLNQVAISMNNLYRSGHSQTALDWDQLDDHLKQSKIAASEHLFYKVRILLGEEGEVELTAENLSRAYRIYKENSKNPEILDLYRKIEHQRWLRFYTFYNWTWGPVHDRALRQDPCISNYEDLSPELKAYSDYAWELLGEIHLDS